MAGVALVAVSLLASSCKSPREAAIERARKAGAATVCTVDTVATCVAMDKTECMAEAQTYVEECIEETLPDLPTNADKDQATEWSHELGRCLPKRFLPAMKNMGKLKPDCPFRK